MNCPYIHNEKCNRGCRGFQCRHRDEKRAAFLAQIEACKRDMAALPDWMKQTAAAPAWMASHATDWKA